MSFFHSPGIGHITGVVHDIAGYFEGAGEAYQAASSSTSGVWNSISGVLNSIPVVGHAKGLVHDIAGDHNWAREAYQAASSSSTSGGLDSIADNSLKKSKKSYRLKNGRLRHFDPNIEYDSPSSDSTASDDDDEEYIYFFRCLNGTWKVGRTSHIKDRLNTHRINGKINNDSYITVYKCCNAVVAETQILREERIRQARINGTEFLDSSQVEEEYVLNVIRTEVAQANGVREPDFKRFKLSRMHLYFP